MIFLGCLAGIKISGNRSGQGQQIQDCHASFRTVGNYGAMSHYGRGDYPYHLHVYTHVNLSHTAVVLDHIPVCVIRNCIEQVGPYNYDCMLQNVVEIIPTCTLWDLLRVPQ